METRERTYRRPPNCEHRGLVTPHYKHAFLLLLMLSLLVLPACPAFSHSVCVLARTAVRQIANTPHLPKSDDDSVVAGCGDGGEKPAARPMHASDDASCASLSDNETLSDSDDMPCFVAASCPPPTRSIADIIASSGKIQVFVRLVCTLRAEGKRILVFSQARPRVTSHGVAQADAFLPSPRTGPLQWSTMLDIIEQVLRAIASNAIPPEYLPCAVAPSPGMPGAEAMEDGDVVSSARPARVSVEFSRIDGKVPAKKRSQIVDAFNAPHSRLSVMLLTSGAGSVGLTLTSATRVIIFEPCWNPTVDIQAVDRAHRIGQLREVVTYRLITCGSVEERMYRRQVRGLGVPAPSSPSRCFCRCLLLRSC